MCEKKKTDRSEKNRDVGHVEHERIVDPTAGHVQKIRDRSVNEAVRNVAQRATNQQARADAGHRSVVLAMHPNRRPCRNRQRQNNQNPARRLKQAEIYSFIPAHLQCQQRRQHLYASDGIEVQNMNHAIFRRLISKKQ